MKKIFALSLVLLTSLIPLVFSDSGSTNSLENIIDMANANPEFSSFSTAVLASTIILDDNNPGPLTVFAPVDAAFDLWPANVFPSLLTPEGQSLLDLIVSHHVINGGYKVNDLLNEIQNNGGSFTLTTNQGGTLVLTEIAGTINITDIEGNVILLTQSDMQATNGIIHGVDKVFRLQK